MRVVCFQSFEAAPEYELLCIFQSLSPYVTHTTLDPDIFPTAPGHIVSGRPERVATPTEQIALVDRAKLIGAYDGGMDEGVGTGRVDDQFVVLGIIAQQRQMVATLLTT